MGLFIDSVEQATNLTNGKPHRLCFCIYGFNFSILTGFFIIIFSKLFGRWWGFLVSLVAIAAYALLVGACPSVVRAAWMGGLSLFAVQLGHRQDGLNSLALVAAVMALIHPNVLWDVVFQLSFAATLGLALYAEPFTRSFQRLVARRLSKGAAQRLSGWVGEYFLFTLPVLVYHFRSLSLVSLVANPLVLPAQPAVMIIGGLSMLLSSAYLPLGQLAASFVNTGATARAMQMLSPSNEIFVITRRRLR